MADRQSEKSTPKSSNRKKPGSKTLARTSKPKKKSSDVVETTSDSDSDAKEVKRLRNEMMSGVELIPKGHESSSSDSDTTKVNKMRTRMIDEVNELAKAERRRQEGKHARMKLSKDQKGENFSPASKSRQTQSTVTNSRTIPGGKAIAAASGKTGKGFAPDIADRRVPPVRVDTPNLKIPSRRKSETPRKPSSSNPNVEEDDLITPIDDEPQQSSKHVLRTKPPTSFSHGHRHRGGEGESASRESKERKRLTGLSYISEENYSSGLSKIER